MMTKACLLAAALALFVACATTVPDPPLDQDGDGGTGSDSAETGGKASDTGGTNTGGSSAAGGGFTGGSQGPSTGGAPTEGGAGTGGVAATGTPRDEVLYGKLTLEYTPSGTTQFSLDLINTTGQDLKLAGLEIRYWFTPEGAITDAVVECYSVQGAVKSCSDLTRTLIDGAQPYLSIAVNVPDTHTFWASTGEPDKIEGLQISIHRQDYQGDDMTNDYSYQATEGANSKVTVYYNGLLVLGEEPPL
jgi:hypothetical protein